MELIPIFVDDTEGSVKGLFAVRYDGEQLDEFERLFDNWSDANYVFSYFLINEEYLKDSYFENYSIEDLCNKVGYEAIAIQNLFLDFEAAGFLKSGSKLEALFKPLDPKNKQFSEDV